MRPQGKPQGSGEVSSDLDAGGYQIPPIWPPDAYFRKCLTLCYSHLVHKNETIKLYFDNYFIEHLKIWLQGIVMVNRGQQSSIFIESFLLEYQRAEHLKHLTF